MTPSWKDPIVEEARAAGRQLVERAGGDVHSFFAYLRRAQQRYSAPLAETPDQAAPASDQARPVSPQR